MEAEGLPQRRNGYHVRSQIRHEGGSELHSRRRMCSVGNHEALLHGPNEPKTM